MAKLHPKAIRDRIHRRIRKKVSGTAERPRLCVYFSGRNITAQLIDDVLGRTLAYVSTLEKGNFSDITTENKANCVAAARVGKLLAARAKALNVVKVVFDRGGFQYHGKVKTLADAAREEGLSF